jgi:hypothetical protein
MRRFAACGLMLLSSNRIRKIKGKNRRNDIFNAIVLLLLA